MESKDREQTQTPMVKKRISRASLDNLISLDLSKMNLTEVPSSLLRLQQLEQLYLEGNLFQHLPDQLFVELSNLLWLDLRNNRLEDIPACIGQHKKLRTLLLGGNNLQYLPAELGQIQSLSGLNLVGNPLIEPPSDVVQKGVLQVKFYLLKKLGIEGVTLFTSSSDSDSDSLSEEEVNMLKANKNEKIGKGSSKVAQPKDKSKDTSHLQPNTTSFNSIQLSLDNSELRSKIPEHGSSWFIHKPWTTGVYFTGSWIKNKNQSASK